jgi:hypothetical protein
MAKKYVRKDLVGQRFGRLTVVRFVELHITPSNKYGQSKWECLCDCGKNIILQDRTLLRKAAQSCGCYRVELCRKPPGESTITALYCSYKCGAKKRNFSFSLTREQFVTLIAGNCNYCGALPTEYSQLTRSKSSIEWLKQCTILCNRIDRVDSNVGYELTNCVSCCKRCNEMKMAATNKDFLDHVRKIYNFQNGDHIE